MDQRLLRALCVVPVCVLWGCGSPPAKTPTSLPTVTQQCTTQPCEVRIKLELRPVVLADGRTKEFCVGTLPETIEFPNTAPGNPDKTITWILDKTLVPTMDVEFLEKNGILKIGEKPPGNGQFNPDNQRTDKVTYKGTNKHKQKDTQATYVPLIIRFVNDVPEVCATADPKIINL